MLKFNVTWPEQFSCEELPEYHRGMCITPEAFIARAKPSTGTDYIYTVIPRATSDLTLPYFFSLIFVQQTLFSPTLGNSAITSTK